MTNQIYERNAGPLSNLEIELEGLEEESKRISANKAFGFVLISMGIFTLGIGGLFGFLAPWPITLAGAGSLLGGIILRNEK